VTSWSHGVDLVGEFGEEAHDLVDEISRQIASARTQIFAFWYDA
jgi:hypothetical protein